MSLEQKLQSINTLRIELDALRPLPPHTVASLREQLIVAWTYHSNAIEGNTLTLKETKVVLEGITIGGKSMREHFEAVNHKEAIEYVEQIVAGNEALSEHQVRCIHQLILKNIDAKNAGTYRHENVVISGAQHVPPDHTQIAEHMHNLLSWYDSARSQHPIERAARLHSDFVKVHPFVDGNGRTARLLMNFELLKSGYLPVVIETAERLLYYDNLDCAHTTADYSPFILQIADLEINSLQSYLKVIRKI